MVNQVPTLFIGIGGIGCKIAGAISDMLSSADRDYVGVIGIDTDLNSINDRIKEGHRMSFIQTSDNWKVEDYLSLHPEHERWFPDSVILRKRKMLKGAGQVRVLSRLTFAAAEESGKFDPIFTEINRIRKVGANRNNNIVIVLVGSITGGTGAGMFIELPLFLRNNVKNKCGVDSCTVRGMFVGADITEVVQNETFMKENVRVNGYTCLKELNAFNIHHIEQNDLPNEVRTSLELENYDSENNSPDNVPYDYLYLYEKNGNIGSVGVGNLDEIISYISHIAFSLLFTPIGPNAESVEDNYILESIRQNMLNRYVGAGVCRLVYPKEQAQQYVTLSLVNGLVEEEWLLLDKRYHAQNNNALKRQATDHTVKLPILRNVYVEEFEKETYKDTGSHLLAKYTGEAFDVKDDSYDSKADKFISSLTEKVTRLMESDEVTKYKSACEFSKAKMKSFSLASNEISRLWEALKKYTDVARQLKSDKPNSFAEDLFPSTMDSLLSLKDSPDCIYSYLADVHPIVARYLIYDMINKLTAMSEELDNELNGIDLVAYKSEDYYTDDKRDKETQTPSQALNLIKNRYFQSWTKKAFKSEEKELHSLANKLDEVAERQVGVITSYLENSITYAVCMILIERLTALADRYEGFFDRIEKNIDVNNASLKNLVNITFPYGQEGVYCTKAAFDRMTETFKVRNGESMVLSSDTKKAIFEELYRIQANDYNRRTMGITESLAERELRESENDKALDSVFNRSVLATVRHSVVEHGNGITNLSVKEALEKEYLLTGSKNKNESEYIKDRVDVALRIATPMISTTSEGSIDNELIFMAMSERNSVQTINANNENQPDNTSTINYYLSSSYDTMLQRDYIHALIDSEFGNEAIVFIKISYGHRIEDLSKYLPDSDNWKAYEARIKALVNQDSTRFVEVTPHLNKYWHEEGFIPAMHDFQRDEDKKNIVRAFIYGLGYNCFEKWPYGDKTVDGRRIYKWYYVRPTPSETRISKRGELIGTDYIDLYNALFFNGNIKNAVINYADKKLKEAKGFNSAEMMVEGILDNEMIKDFIQNPNDPYIDIDDNRLMGSINIFDIFVSMYSFMKKPEWEMLVYGFRDLMWDAMALFFNGNADMINTNMRKVLDSIIECSELNGKQLSDCSEAQRMMKNKYEEFCETEYVEKRY